MINQTQIERMHEIYTALTGYSYPLSMPKLWAWEQWLVRGYTAEDLQEVAGFLKRGINDRRRHQTCLTFRNLIENYDLFGDALAEAKSQARVSAKLNRQWENRGKQTVLKATGRPVEPKSQAMSTAAIMQQHSLMSTLLRNWRLENL